MRRQLAWCATLILLTLGESKKIGLPNSDKWSHQARGVPKFQLQIQKEREGHINIMISLTEPKMMRITFQQMVGEPPKNIHRPYQVPELN